MKQTTSSNEDASATPNVAKPKKKKKKKKFKINTDLIGVESVSSDGLLTETKKIQKKEQEARSAIKSNLGASSKRKMKDRKGSDGGVMKKVSKKAEKISQQRNGSVDSTLQAGLALPEDQNVEVQVRMVS